MYGSDQDVAKAYLFLAPDQVSYIVASVMPLDGGSVAGNLRLEPIVKMYESG